MGIGVPAITGAGGGGSVTPEALAELGVVPGGDVTGVRYECNQNIVDSADNAAARNFSTIKGCIADAVSRGLTFVIIHVAGLGGYPTYGDAYEWDPTDSGYGVASGLSVRFDIDANTRIEILPGDFPDSAVDEWPNLEFGGAGAVELSGDVHIQRRLPWIFINGGGGGFFLGFDNKLTMTNADGQIGNCVLLRSRFEDDDPATEGGWFMFDGVISHSGAGYATFTGSSYHELKPRAILIGASCTKGVVDGQAGCDVLAGPSFARVAAVVEIFDTNGGTGRCDGFTYLPVVVGVSVFDAGVTEAAGSSTYNYALVPQGSQYVTPIAADWTAANSATKADSTAAGTPSVHVTGGTANQFSGIYKATTDRIVVAYLPGYIGTGPFHGIGIGSSTKAIIFGTEADGDIVVQRYAVTGTFEANYGNFGAIFRQIDRPPLFFDAIKSGNNIVFRASWAVDPDDQTKFKTFATLVNAYSADLSSPAQLYGFINVAYATTALEVDVFHAQTN